MRTKERQENQMQYLVKLLGAIQTVFDEEGENYIDANDFVDSDKLTDFIHVLANGVPASIYNRITGSDVNHLDFNHLANKLCFQNSNLK